MTHSAQWRSLVDKPEGLNYHMRISLDYRLVDVLASPVDRIQSTPPWAWCVGACAAAFQLVKEEAFVGAIMLVFIVGVFDYVVGVKAARMNREYNSDIARAGAMGKMSGLILLLLLWLIEHWIRVIGVIDTGGMVATAVAVSLIAVDLQSIAHHRESFGAKPIPVLSQVLNWLQDVFTNKIPRV